MGGFSISETSSDGTAQIKRLSPYHLDSFLKNGEIEVTEDEILDRSKGDGLAKTLAIFQTVWFIIQFLTRIARRLPITEIELVTIAFAALNFGTYFFWWQKPLNVTCTIRVKRKGGSSICSSHCSTGMRTLGGTLFSLQTVKP
jgi:hypothetical protein